MKIEIGPASYQDVTIVEYRSVGVVLIFSEEATSFTDPEKLREAIEVGAIPNAKVTGKIVLAKEYELDLFRKASVAGIRIRDSFMATDTYGKMGSKEKDQFWMGADPAVTIGHGTNSHYLNGKGPLPIEELLARYNAGLSQSS